jgi:hypothetical protein
VASLLGGALLSAGGCGGAVGACAVEPDPGGTWVVSAAPLVGDGGTPAQDPSDPLLPGTLPRPVELVARLEVVVPTESLFSYGRYVRGTVESADPDFFSTLMIPPLLRNDGSKTGSTLGCRLQLNVPIEQNVTDDNREQGPLRLALGGRLLGEGRLQGDPLLSHLVMVSDPTGRERRFAWTAVRP